MSEKARIISYCILVIVNVVCYIINSFDISLFFTGWFACSLLWMICDHEEKKSRW